MTASNHNSTAGLTLRPKQGLSLAHTEEQGTPFRHSDAEWDTVYPHIKRMYVVERRKVRYIVDNLAREHDFRLSPWTLRKRLSHWKLHKNTRSGLLNSGNSPHNDAIGRKAGKRAISREVSSTIRNTAARTGHLPSPPKLQFSSDEAEVLDLFTSIKAWTLSFLESVRETPSADIDERVLAPKIGLAGQVYDAVSLSFAFRLIPCLLDEGEGVSAGQLVRKTFLQIETILDAEGPLVIWNLFEIYWHMMKGGQMKIPKMLSAHLYDLARVRFPSQHPLLRVLRVLDKLVDNFGQGLYTNLEAVNQGWAINAHLLFTPPDPRLLLLYYRLTWDSDLVQLPTEQIRSADRIFASMEEKMPTAPTAARFEVLAHGVIVRRDNQGKRVQDGIQLPENYYSLIDQSIIEIHELCLDEPEGSYARLRALSGLLKSRLYQSEVKDNKLDPSTQRLHAGVLAYVLRIILEAKNRRHFVASAAISRLKDIIALREYAQDPTSPQLLFEMRELENMLHQSGHIQEAYHIHQDRTEWLRRYVEEIS